MVSTTELTEQEKNILKYSVTQIHSIHTDIKTNISKPFEK